MKIKHLLTISLAVFLSACTNQNDSIPIQANNDGYINEYQNAPITNSQITNTEDLVDDVYRNILEIYKNEGEKQ